MSADTEALNLPWYADYDHDRLVFDAEHNLVAMTTTAEQATVIAQTVSAGDLDAKAEATRLTALVGHYKHRTQMTPSDRQGVLGESAKESIQPENWYIVNIENPAKALRSAVENALAAMDLAGTAQDDPIRESLTAALTKFNKDTPNWWY